MELTPYWLASAPPFRAAASGPVEGRADVAVIGGGFTGLSAAYALAGKGASVVVLEHGRVVSQASGRNGGHVNGGSAHSFRAAVAHFGLERASRYYKAYDEGVDLIEQLVQREAIDCQFVRRGKMKLAYKPHHFDDLRRDFEALVKTVEPGVKLLSREEARKEVASDGFHGGLLFESGAMMHVARFGVGLAEAAARRGARIFENAGVTGLERRADGSFRLTTPRGSIEAKQVLVATGATTSGPFGYFRRRFVPFGSFIIATAPLGDNLAKAVMPGNRTVATTKNIGNYFRLTPDNRLIFGGRARFAISSPQSDAKSGTILERKMLELFPPLAGVKIDYCWGGLIDVTPDRYPRAGEHKGLYYAMGYSGHGTQMAVRMGHVMTEVMDGHPERNPFHDLGWPAIPGHFGPPWFLPLVGAYYRFKDMIN
jgi:glycine/D-amino acid oxidase-like deaminating enzyme